VTAGVRGVGGEVKRKAVDQGYLEGWLAGWLWLWWAADKLAAPPDGNLPNKAEERRREGDFFLQQQQQQQQHV
jgi:hypothetical protein